jgi:parallel beta-helix repeat protein
MKKFVLLSFVLALLLIMIIAYSSNVLAWSNGGYSDDPSNPDYGTHDWIAEHALDWLPENEKLYIEDNLATYLYGTELPDNGIALDGIGDTANHHIYYWSNESLQDDPSAVRAEEEYNNTLHFLESGDLANASKTAGIMSHYIVDVAVFGHVMGAATDWGAEVHHSDYETYVNQRTLSYDAEFNAYLSFDGELDIVSAYDTAKELAYNTTFDADGDLTCVWMDQNYNWSNSVFKDRCGESLNLAVNCLTDVLHTLYLEIAPVHNIDSGKNFSTIQEAINDNETLEGHTIFVEAGTYYENVIINKSISLIGENKSNTIISGLDLGHGPSWGLVSITASSAVVTGFTIRDFITSTQIGIFMRNSYHCNISGNIIVNHSYGIDIRQSEDNFIGNNTVSKCSTYGIVISESSKNNTLRNNNLTGNNWNLGVFSYFFHDIDTSNIVDGKPVYYWVNQKDKEVSNDAGYIALVNSTNIVVNNLTIAHNQGVLLAHTTNSTIEYVNVSTSLRGFYLINSHNNTICRCDTTQTAEGIRLEVSNNNQISENTISHYYDVGIMFEDSERNSITNNEVSVDWVDSNSFGIFGGNNIIYNNNILNHSKRFFSDGSPNTWDNGYPSGGNYWSDYNGTDLYSGPCQNETGSDGIGDTPYFIDANNQDNYPLMSPWGSVEEKEEGSPFWMQWWLWAIVAVVIVALAGTVYFLKKKKPSTPTTPTLPTEGTLQNIPPAHSCNSHLQTKILKTPIH